MSSMSRPGPPLARPSPKPRAAAGKDDPRLAIQRIARLAALALATSLLAGAFAGILVFVVGLAAFAAYAASHPHRA